LGALLISLKTEQKMILLGNSNSINKTPHKKPSNQFLLYHKQSVQFGILCRLNKTKNQ